MQPPEDRPELWRVSHELTQLARPCVAAFYLGGRIAFGHTQGRAQRGLQVQLMLEALGRIGKRLEHLQAFGEMRHGLEMRRAFEGTPARSLPIHHSLLPEARFSIV